MSVSNYGVLSIAFDERLLGGGHLVVYLDFNLAQD
jgi:hypothetical protein